ncbi:MAG TPA: hypothetical protein VER96_25035 [Polyangiaceae bacterium]|nr:hypothetical protein [Polyangiaceae bacterium]
MTISFRTSVGLSISDAIEAMSGKPYAKLALPIRTAVTKLTHFVSAPICAAGCCLPPPSDGGGGSGGTCPPDWKIYVASEGTSTGTPPPTNGGCPEGYVITIQNGQQYCTAQVVVR